MKKYLLIALALVMWLPSVALGYPEKLEKKNGQFIDHAGLVSKPVAQSLNKKLDEFEKATTNEFAVLILPKLDTGDVAEEVALNIFRKSGLGKKDKNNGALLVYFQQSSSGKGKLRLEIGDGLEGVMTDGESVLLLAKIAPLLREKKFDEAMTVAVDSMIAMEKGEFKAEAKDKKDEGLSTGGIILLIIIIIIIVLIISLAGIGPFIEFIFHLIGALLSGGGGGGGSSSGGGFGGGSCGGGGASFDV